MTSRHKAKPRRAYECPCGTDNAHREGGNYQPTFDGLQRIVKDSTEAANATDFHPAFETWVASLRAVAPTFGAVGYKDLKVKLEEMMRREADWQAAGYREKSKVAGEVHGGRRGLVQEAQHQMARAQEKLAELKAHEAKEARAKVAKTKAKEPKPEKASAMTEAQAVTAGEKRGRDGIKAMTPKIVAQLAAIDGFDWAAEPRRFTVHRLDKVPDKLGPAYYTALGSAASKLAGRIVARQKS